MIKFKISLILLTISLSAFTAHKYYISLTKVDYKKESETLQITMRIFIDDLEETINKTYTKKIELAIANESKEIDSLINLYINTRFSIKINDKTKTYHFLGKEYENDVVYLYLESVGIKNTTSIEIKNNMLMELFSKQKNIIKINILNTKKTFFLTKENDTDQLTL